MFVGGRRGACSVQDDGTVAVPELNPVAAPEPDFRPTCTSISRFHAWEPARVEGRVPADLRGTLVRTGPGVFERFGVRLAHAFEADGALTGIRFHGDGRVDTCVRLVEGRGYRQEERAGKPLFGSAAPWWRRLANGLLTRAKSTGNTNLLQWQGRLYALMEGGRPIEVDPLDLGSIDETDLGGLLASTFSAHPHRLASERTTYNFGQVWGPRPALQLYALPDEGPGIDLGRVALPWNAMVHDFAVTPGYAVFLICPAKLRIHKALLGSPDFDQYFAWNPAAHAELVIVPLADVSHPIRIQIPARWIFHLCNAFTRGSELVVDWVEYPDFSIFTSLSGQAPREVKSNPRPHRLVVDLPRARVTSDTLIWDEKCDFPVVAPRLLGHDYDACWFFTEREHAYGGVARLELGTGRERRWEAGHGHRLSEPIFVPRRDASDDDSGRLLVMGYDAWKQESYVAILDAAHPEAGPSATVWLGQVIPPTYHGTFVAA